MTLNVARVPFALYINAVHTRIHPAFAETLASLDQLPKGDQPDQDLVTRLEIVLGKDDGWILRLGVIASSGILAFDVAALDAVDRAQPFGPAPNVIASPDGRVHLHWEFHQDPHDGCAPPQRAPLLAPVGPLN